MDPIFANDDKNSPSFAMVLQNQHPGVPTPGDATVLPEAGECRAAAKNVGTSDNVGGSGGSFKANDLPSSPSASVMLDSLLAEDELDEEEEHVSHSTDNLPVEGRISEGAGDGPPTIFLLSSHRRPCR